MKNSRSKKWTLATALLAVTLCLSLFIGTIAFAQGGEEKTATSYKSITATLTQKLDIPDDHTAESIKSILEVVGTKDDSTEKVTDYSVEINGSADGKLIVGDTNTMTVSAGSVSCSVDMEGTRVIAAPIVSVELAAVNGYELQGDYYIDGDGFYAFTQGMSADEVTARLRVLVRYPNSVKEIAMTDAAVKSVNIGNTGTTDSTNAERLGVNIAVNVEVDGEAKSLNQEINFRRREFGALEVRGYTAPTNLTSATRVTGANLELSAGSGRTYIYAIWNNGNSSDENISFEALNFNGLSFAPTGAAIKEALTSSNDVYYDSTLEIPYTGANGSAVKPLSLSFRVKYSAPTSVNTSLQGSLKNQQALSDKVDVDGVFVEFVYSAVNKPLVPLSEFDGYTFTYYTDDEMTQTTGTLTRNVKVIEINGTVTCKTTTGVKEVSVSGAFSVTIDRKPIDRPVMENNELKYRDDGCYTSLTLPDVGEEMDVTTSSEYAAYKDGVLTFTRGGTFTVTVSLKDQNDSTANVYFSGNTNYYDAAQSNDYITVFNITVLKAPVTVTLDGYAAKRQYGDAESFTVNGAVVGNATMNFQATNRADISGQGDSTETPTYQLYYYGATLSGATTKATATTTVPTERGTYNVFAKTAETALYQEGESEEVEFEITHRYISYSTLGTEAVFDNTEKTLGDFLNLGGNTFASGDDLDAVLTIIDNPGEIKHAQTYNVKLSFTSGAGSNYAWAKDDRADKPITFTITPAQLSFSVNQGSFTYGSEMPSATVNTDGLRGWVDLAAPVYSGTANNGTTIGNSSTAPVNAGTYKATYSIDTYSVKNGVLSTDVTCSSVNCDFEIFRKEITKLEIDRNNDDTSYTGGEIEFSIKNWGKDTLAWEDTYASILTVEASGLLHDGTTEVLASRITTAEGKITVIDAGVYAFTITLGANYTWIGAANSNAEPEKVTAENVTINKAKLSPVLSESTFKYDGLNHVPEINCTLLDTGVSIDGFTRTISFGGTVINDETTIINAGTYTVSVTDFAINTNVEGAAYTYKVNYELANNPFELTFSITTPFIKKPTLTNGKTSVVETYKSAAYDFTAYIANYSDYLYGADNGQKMLKIVISGAGSSLLNAGTYTVEVSPEANFRWSDGLEPEGDGGNAAIPFTFTVDKKAIAIDWSKATLSQVFNGKAHTVAGYVISSKCGTDDIDVDFTYSANAGSSLNGGNVVDVGSYTVTATGLKGAKQANYTLENGIDLSNDNLVITPFKIAAPQMDDASATLEFGKNTTKTFTLTDYEPQVAGFDWIDVLNVNITGAWKFDGVDKAHTTDYDAWFEIGSNTKATFTFANAGTYSFTFAIKNNNYVWEDGITNDPTAEFTVERATITAPSLASARAMEWTKPITELNTILTGSVDGVTYSVLYGKRNGSVTSSTTQKDVDRPGGAAARGQYYALLTINGDNAWNYQWAAANDGTDDKGNPIFTGGNFIESSGLPYAITYTQDKGAQISLYYAITASQVTISYSVNNYLFGANGFVDGVIITNENSATIDNTLIRDNSGIPENATIQQITILFYAQGSTDPLSNDELVNDLPWKVGTYDVKITIDFTEPNTYQQWNSSGLTLTVSARPIAVEWSFENADGTTQTGTSITTTFNGRYQIATPVISNMPKKTAEDSTVAPALTCNLTGNNRPFNAGTYTLSVNGITGEGAGNFTTNDGENLNCQFVIERYGVSIDVTGVTGHVYGDTIKSAEKVWTATSNNFFNTDGNNVVIKLLKKGSADTTDYANNNKAPVGTYVLTPDWNGAAKTNVTDTGYTLTTTNYVITVTTADFEVVAREITVKFKDGASSVYGETVDLYKDSVYEVSKVNGVDDGILFDNAKTVFTLSAKKSGIEASNRTAVGSYALSCEQKADNANYIVRCDNNDGKCTYEITNATIKNATITSGHETGAYDGKAYPLFKDNTATLVNDDLVTAHWWYKGENDDDWTEFTGQTRKDVIDVTYQIKVTADNHDDLTLDGTVSFVIAKRTLYVQIGLTIKYGERSPADFDGNGNVYNTVITDTGMYTVTGFADGENIGNIAGVTGSFTYTTDYVQGSPVGGSYYLRFVNDENAPLEATNYEFANKDGVLTVKKLVLTVAIADVSTVYWTDFDKAMFNGTTVTLPKSTYDSDKAADVSDDIKNSIFDNAAKYQGANIIELTTTAYNSERKTNAVSDSYEISGSVEVDKVDNFGATFTGSLGDKAKHAITAANLTLSDITGYNAPYDETSHLAVVIKDGGEVVEYLAKTSDGSPVTVSFFAADYSADAVDASGFDWSAVTPLSANPSYIDVCHKHVYYRIEADNYQTVTGRVETNISKADNGFKTEFAIAGNAWTYGLYDSENNTLGYDKDVAHKITDAVFKFSRKDGENGANKVQITIKRNGATMSEYSGKYETVSVLFQAVCADGAFTVGEYTVSFSMAETDNYNELGGEFTVTVNKKELSVKANAQNVVYGAETPTYTYKVTGFVNNGKMLETEDGVLGASKHSFFTSTYSAGLQNGSVGTYNIVRFEADGTTVLPGLDTVELDNYTLNFEGSALTVAKRVVTITIGNKKNTYNLQGGETAQTLTFTIDGTLFFDGDVTAPSDGVYNNGNQSILTLHTEALTNKDHPDIKTNNVIVNTRDDKGNALTLGGYAIYAEYNEITAGGEKWSKNYEINVNAGLYTIEQASLSVSLDGVYHLNEKQEEVKGDIYSGAENYYKATLGDGTVTPEYKYYSVKGNNETETTTLVNTGNYAVYIRSSSDNYKSIGDVRVTFTIAKATLTLKANTATVQYGTTLTGTEGEDTLDGRFSGFTYSSKSDTLLPDVLSKYLTDHKVTFRTNGYSAQTPVSNSNCFIIPVCFSDNNVRIDADATTKLAVVKRQVKVTINGWENGNEAYAWGYYQGTQPGSLAELTKQFDGHIDSFITLVGENTFGASGNDRTALSVRLNLPADAIKVTDSGYRMSVSSDASNYDVTFVTADKRETKSIADTDEDAPVFMIKKTPLVIYANTRDSGNRVNTYSVTYGNQITGLTYSVDGMKNGESFEGQLAETYQSVTHKAVLNDGVYTPWESKVGQTYTVSIDKLNDFANYDLSNLDNYITTTLAITPRQISVTTPTEITYDKAADGYHGGVYGKAHEAELLFGYNVGSDTQNAAIDAKYRPKYKKLVYNTVSSDGQTAGEAPTKVGEYTVTVELNDANYVFAAGKKQTLNFKVIQHSINEYGLAWDQSALLLQEGGDTKFTNFIGNYVDDIMEVVTFSYSTGSGSIQLPLGNASTVNSYYFNDKGQLCAYVEGRGTYTVQFRLKDTATHNYRFESRDGTLVTSYFSVTSTSLSMTLSIDGWQYNDAPNAPVTHVNGVLMESEVIYTYALITGTFDTDLLGHDLTNIDGISRNPLSSNVTFNAGYYVLCAAYEGPVQNEDGTTETQRVIRYYIFQVTKRAVSAPTVEADGYKFNGQEQSLTVNYDDTLMRASFDGRVGTADGGITVYATNVDTYGIKFTLVNSNNYEWASDANAVDGVVTLSWTIAIDDVENDGHISVPNFNEAVFGSVKIASWNVKQGYGNNVTVYHAVREENQTAQDATDWVKGLPVGTNVGDYWIKLVLSDGNVNFTDKETFAELTVKPLEIYATATGSVTYGDDFETDGTLDYSVSGLLFGNTVTETDIKYVLAENYGVLNAGGTYFVLLDTDEDGVVKGLSAGGNYVIKAKQGALTVNRRAVTVTLGTAFSQYGEDIDLSGVTVTYSNNLAENGLVVEKKTEATKDSFVGGYLIGIEDDYDKVNYVVTVNYGTYTITQRQITVELTAGGGEYASNAITPVSYSAVLDKDGKDIFDFVQGKLTLTVTYTGVANNGTAFTNSTSVPTLAGTYIATVRGSGNSNFIIVGEPFTQFVITQKEVDASKLVIGSVTYDKEAHRPVVTVPNEYHDMFYYNDNGSDALVFTQDEQSFTNADTHNFVLTLKDAFNYKWKSSDVAERQVQFVIEKANNALVGNIAIQGWQFGDYDVTVNSPTASVLFGNDRIVFTYSSSQNGTYTSGAPIRNDVGTYWVRVTVAQDPDGNYNAFESAPISFRIERKALNVPTLSVMTEGENKNDVYTGSELFSAILGFDITLMDLGYEGHTGTIGGNMVVYATNAGTYTVTLTLVNDANYRWANVEGKSVDLNWTIARQKVAKPTANNDTFIVNGQTLTYIPVGFNEDIMSIDGNRSAYGGKFTVTVGLKDTANYVWEDDTFDDVTFDWSIVGINTVFTIVVCVLSGACAATLVWAGVQLLLYRRRKHAIDKAIDERSLADEQATQDKKEGGNE